jgi:hypothetical protein
MVDVHCRKCTAVVLRVDEVPQPKVKRPGIKMTWPDGRRVGMLDPPKCPTCGDEFQSVNANTWQTLGQDDLALLEKTVGQLPN